MKACIRCLILEVPEVPTHGLHHATGMREVVELDPDIVQFSSNGREFLELALPQVGSKDIFPADHSNEDG